MTILVLVQFLYPQLNFIRHLLGIHLTFRMGGLKPVLTDAMTGAAYAIQSFIPLFVRCDRSDIHVVPQVKAVHTNQANIFHLR